MLSANAIFVCAYFRFASIDLAFTSKVNFHLKGLLFMILLDERGNTLGIILESNVFIHPEYYFK